MVRTVLRDGKFSFSALVNAEGIGMSMIVAGFSTAVVGGGSLLWGCTPKGGASTGLAGRLGHEEGGTKKVGLLLPGVNTVPRRRATTPRPWLHDRRRCPPGTRKACTDATHTATTRSRADARGLRRGIVVPCFGASAFS